jgi:hypothetical protein
MAPATFISAKNPAYWWQSAPVLSSRFWKVACSALGLVKVKVSKGNSVCLSKKLSIEGTVGDEYFGEWVFVTSSLIGDSFNCQPFLQDAKENMYGGKFNVPADVLLPVMMRVGKGALKMVSSDDVSCVHSVMWGQS